MKVIFIALENYFLLFFLQGFITVILIFIRFNNILIFKFLFKDVRFLFI